MAFAITLHTFDRLGLATQASDVAGQELKEVYFQTREATYDLVIDAWR